MGILFRVSVGMLLFLRLAAAQTVPAIAEVPTCGPASDRTNLTQQRQALSSQRDQLRSAISSHDNACQNVSLNSPQAVACSKEQTQLGADKNRHIDRTNVFNQSVKAAEAVCGSSGNLPIVASRVKGSIFLVTTTGRTRLSEGQAIPPGAQIATGANSAIELQFSSGERVEMGPNTTFAFDPDPSEPSLLQGLMRLVHECIGGNANCLRRVTRVHVPTAIAGVRGTDFLVDSTAGGTTISVFQGSVEVTGMSPGNAGRPTGAPVLLRDGQRIQIDNQGKVGAPLAIPSASAPNWWN